MKFKMGDGGIILPILNKGNFSSGPKLTLSDISDDKILSMSPY